MAYNYSAAALAQSQGMSYQDFAIAVAQNQGIPTDLFLAQIGQESGWNPNAQASGSSATGIAQFIKSTAAAFGIDPKNPYQSIQAAGYYDSQLYKQTGSWANAMKSYGTTANGNGASVAALATQYDQNGNNAGLDPNRVLIGSGAGVDVYAIGNSGSGATGGAAGSSTIENNDGTSSPTSFGLLPTGITNLFGSAGIILLGIILIILAFLLTDKGQETIRVVATKS